MKLKRIYIKSYKNIHEQELTFCDGFGYLALIGENGSGKTNWLEAISMIFRSLYAKDVSFSYELEYESGEHLYKLIHKKRGEKYSLSIRIDGKVAKRDAVVLPRIISCYSGESNRLWNLAYRDYFNHFFKRAIRNKLDIPEMLYVNKYYWNIALITLMCSEDPAIKDFLKAHFGIENLDSISVTFDLLPENIGKFSDNKVTQLLTRIDRGEQSTIVPMSELASLDIDYRNNHDFCRKIFYYLFIASLPEVNNDNPVSKAISQITVKINDINAYSLSEGEQKMILIECLTQLLADENTVLVFDEPDAHVHIASKIEIVTAISSFRGQAILTTHSPVVINELKPECIRYVEKGTINLSDKLETIRRVSGNSFSLIDGAFILSARKLVVTEGPNDISYIKTAISKLGETERKYLRLNHVAFVYQGSASNTKSYISTVIEPIINDMDKILFIFDFDAGQGSDQNGQKGYKEVESVKDQYDGHLECIYYSNDYSVEPSVFYVEDYFTSDFYPEAQNKVNKVQMPLTYRVLKGINGVPSSIKREIEKNYSKKSRDKYEAFRPLLDKLLDVFSLAI